MAKSNPQGGPLTATQLQQIRDERAAVQQGLWFRLMYGLFCSSVLGTGLVGLGLKVATETSWSWLALSEVMFLLLLVTFFTASFVAGQWARRYSAGMMLADTFEMVVMFAVFIYTGVLQALPAQSMTEAERLAAAEKTTGISTLLMLILTFEQIWWVQQAKSGPLHLWLRLVLAGLMIAGWFALPALSSVFYLIAVAVVIAYTIEREQANRIVL